MKADRIETDDLKKELLLRIFKNQKDKCLTLREQRAMAVWLKSGPSGAPSGKARSAVRKLAREFAEFEPFLPKK